MTADERIDELLSPKFTAINGTYARDRGVEAIARYAVRLLLAAARRRVNWEEVDRFLSSGDVPKDQP
jgi:hypothetical protein